VDPGGRIEVQARRVETGEAQLEIRDNGRGVSPEHRADLFKPYFTTHEQGTGLGLAVVQQIVLAHGWEIEFDANKPRGAVFRVRHLKLMKPESDHAS
jgi:signal transduction histidine kinase